jgi:hypothetical protein
MVSFSAAPSRFTSGKAFHPLSAPDLASVIFLVLEAGCPSSEKAHHSARIGTVLPIVFSRISSLKKSAKE